MKKVSFLILFFCLLHTIKSTLFLILGFFYEDFFSFTRNNFIEISFVAKVLPVVFLFFLFFVLLKIKKIILFIFSVVLYELTIYIVGSFFNTISKSIVVNNLISLSLFVFIIYLLIIMNPSLKEDLTR